MLMMKGVDTKESSGVTEETSNREDEKKTEVGLTIIFVFEIEIK